MVSVHVPITVPAREGLEGAPRKHNRALAP